MGYDLSGSTEGRAAPLGPTAVYRAEVSTERRLERHAREKATLAMTWRGTLPAWSTKSARPVAARQQRRTRRARSRSRYPSGARERFSAGEPTTMRPTKSQHPRAASVGPVDDASLAQGPLSRLGGLPVRLVNLFRRRSVRPRD